MPLYRHAPYDDEQRLRAAEPSVHFSKLIYSDIEDDLIDFCRYVPAVEGHLTVYSTKLWGIILRASAEIDSQLHALVNETESSVRQTTIRDYRARENEFGLSKYTLTCKPEQIQVVPFAAFKADKSPDWWTDYNAVKHRRLDSLKSATLSNALNAVGGLYVVLHRQWGEYLEPRQLALVNGQHIAQAPSSMFSIASTPWA